MSPTMTNSRNFQFFRATKYPIKEKSSLRIACSFYCFSFVMVLSSKVENNIKGSNSYHMGSCMIKKSWRMDYFLFNDFKKSCLQK